jgi:hypothetical protein
VIVKENEYLVVYAGHNAAALLYQRLLKKSCKIELVKAPVKISYGCSHAIKFKEVDMDMVTSESEMIKLKPKGIYKIVKKAKLENYEKI